MCVLDQGSSPWLAFFIAIVSCGIRVVWIAYVLYESCTCCMNRVRVVWVVYVLCESCTCCVSRVRVVCVVYVLCESCTCCMRRVRVVWVVYLLYSSRTCICCICDVHVRDVHVCVVCSSCCMQCERLNIMCSLEHLRLYSQRRVQYPTSCVLALI